MQFTVVDNLTRLQESLMALGKEGQRIALVPTMGALHDGHLSLIELAKKHADAVILSIFVNPLQFSPNEDFKNYPRPLEADLEKAKTAGVTIAYTPAPEDMYSPDFTTTVSPGALGEILCGKSRPSHFNGVATVVTKLLLRVLPHVAVFGQKDYQQLCIIDQLVYDLDIPIEVIGAPTVREKDGLAMSSRNIYLTPEQRKIAPKLYEILKATAHRIVDGASAADAIAEGTSKLTAAGFKADYLEYREAITLRPLPALSVPSRLLAAVWLGNTRLIDNVSLE